MSRLSNLTKRFGGLRPFAIALGLTLTLSGCDSEDGSFTLPINASPSTLVNVLEDPRINEIQAELPEAKIVRSRPSDSELLYTIPGDEPGRDITVHFTMTPQANNTGTDLKVALHMPTIEVNGPNGRVVLKESRVEGKLRDTIGGIGKQLERREGIGNDAETYVMTLGALAIANHKSLIEKVLSNKGEGLGRRFLSRLNGGDDYSFFTNDHEVGEGYDPTPRNRRPDASAEPDADAGRPMVEPTGTSPNPNY